MTLNELTTFAHATLAACDASDDQDLASDVRRMVDDLLSFIGSGNLEAAQELAEEMKLDTMWL